MSKFELQSLSFVPESKHIMSFFNCYVIVMFLLLFCDVCYYHNFKSAFSQ